MAHGYKCGDLVTFNPLEKETLKRIYTRSCLHKKKLGLKFVNGEPLIVTKAEADALWMNTDPPTGNDLILEPMYVEPYVKQANDGVLSNMLE